MSVLIKGMEMPRSCFDCRFSIDGYCQVMEPGARTNDSIVQVTNWCPLIEIPPHGRLVDERMVMHHLSVEIMRDAVKHGGEVRATRYEVEKAIKRVPTVIEAEEGE